MGSHRHLIFATSQQLHLLSHSKSWYVNATFKLCRQPFSQLFTVNVFIKSNDYTKQVSLVFVLMSGKKKDYRGFFRKLLELLSALNLKQVTLDFECTMWKVLRQLPPDVKLMGCVFHWTQALWRKVSLLNSYQICRLIKVKTNKKRNTYLSNLWLSNSYSVALLCSIPVIVIFTEG